MAKIPGSLQERSHPAQGINRDPVTQRGIRVKQGIQDDYSSSCQMQKSPFLYYFGCHEALPPPIVIFLRVTGRMGLARAQTCCFPQPLLPAPACQREEKGEGSRWSIWHAAVAAEMFPSTATSFEVLSLASRLLRGVFEKSLVNACVNTCEQSVGKRVDTWSPGKQSSSPAAGGARRPTGVIGLQMRGTLLGKSLTAIHRLGFACLMFWLRNAVC